MFDYQKDQGQKLDVQSLTGKMWAFLSYLSEKFVPETCFL